MVVNTNSVYLDAGLSLAAKVIGCAVKWMIYERKIGENFALRWICAMPGFMPSRLSTSF
jgi:ABC-type Fe3+ transport system permease subunit